MGKTVRTGAELTKALVDLGKALEKKDLTPTIQKLTLSGFRYITRRTPVRTGFLKSRWAIVVNAPAPSNLLQNPNPAGTFSPPSTPNMNPIEWGDKVTIFNNTEYAYFVDEGKGDNPKQPMIEPTYRYLEGLSKRLLDSISKKKVS